MGNAGGQLTQRGKPVRLEQFAVGSPQLFGALHDLAFQGLLHFVQIINGEFQTLAHAVNRVHQLIQFLTAAPDLNGAVELHGA